MILQVVWANYELIPKPKKDWIFGKIPLQSPPCKGSPWGFSLKNITYIHWDEPILQVSNEKNSGCSGYIRDYTAQFYRDYNKLLLGSLLNKQYNGK